MNEEFYYKLLNIANYNNDINQTLLKIIKEVIEEIKPTNQNLERVCKVAANNIHLKLKENRIEHQIINLSDYNLYEHVVIICRTMIDTELKYYLIDPTFIQFKNSNYFKLLKERSLTTFNNLVEQGYSKINEEEFNQYLSSFGYKDKKLEFNEIFLQLKNKPKIRGC